MKIKKLKEDQLDYIGAICLDPSIGKEQIEAMQKAMVDRINWIKRMMSKGLEVFIAVEKPKSEVIHYKWAGKMLHSDLALHGMVPMGLLESMPIEIALEPIEGKNSLFINCMWILPPFWLTGVGTALLESFINRAKEVGGASVLTYEEDKWFGTSIKYMPSSFFKKFGFKEVDRDGSRILLYLNLNANIKPKLISFKQESFEENDEIRVDIFFNSQCPWSKFMVDLIKEKRNKYPEVTFKFINTDDRKIIEKFGISRGICINGKPVIKRMAAWEEIESEIKKVKKYLNL
ncbi:MAG: GNAT family N-acetyltransferase [Promethearchaeota archaeon]